MSTKSLSLVPKNKKKNGHYIIGVCGASCSGKSTVCERIEQSHHGLSESVIIISQDRYYKGGNSSTNYDVPSAIDFDHLISDLSALKKGKSVQAPIYDFTKHKKKEETDLLKPTPIIIVEGILIFCVPKLRQMFDLKVFVRAKPELRLLRRMKRDVEMRGRTIDEVTNRYLNDVEPSNHNYVEPAMDYADVIVVNNQHEIFIGIDVLLDHIDKRVNLFLNGPPVSFGGEVQGGGAGGPVKGPPSTIVTA